MSRVNDEDCARNDSLDRAEATQHGHDTARVRPMIKDISCEEGNSVRTTRIDVSMYPSDVCALDVLDRLDVTRRGTIPRRVALKH